VLSTQAYEVDREFKILPKVLELSCNTYTVQFLISLFQQLSQNATKSAVRGRRWFMRLLTFVPTSASRQITTFVHGTGNARHTDYVAAGHARQGYKNRPNVGGRPAGWLVSTLRQRLMDRRCKSDYELVCMDFKVGTARSSAKRQHDRACTMRCVWSHGGRTRRYRE